ncbi:MAG: phosphate signaling complex protein PhoU, partial [Hyphomicrobium sp.]
STFDALQNHNPELANKIIEKDLAVDALHQELEERSISIIARRHPVANDLRRVIAALKVSAELERIGDLAKNCAKRAITIAGTPHLPEMICSLGHMSALASSQLNAVLDAFVLRDSARAEDVWVSDEKIDSVYNSIFRQLLSYMMEDAKYVGLCTHLLFIAKNLERIGDHTTNIAETISYMTKATRPSHARPKGDLTTSIL